VGLGRPAPTATAGALFFFVTNKLLHEPTVRLKSAGAAAQDYGHAVRHLFALGEPDAAVKSI